VDFRQLIKVLADTFHVRIEMKQIGARQEAGRIGGTGPCGRELCCATWMKNFVSVSTNTARFQDISLNPQKLAGMCAKLKCCLNYEVDNYIEASHRLPSKEVILQTQDSDYYLFKSDILAGTVSYSTDKRNPVNLETITAERACEIIEMNKRGEKPLSLVEDEKGRVNKGPIDLLAGDDISRFDKSKRKKNRSRSSRAQQPEKQQQPDKQVNKQQIQPANKQQPASKQQAQPNNKVPQQSGKQPQQNKPQQPQSNKSQQPQPNAKKEDRGRRREERGERREVKSDKKESNNDRREGKN
jgi:hypothetical protein